MFGFRFKKEFRSVKCESFDVETGEIVKVSYIRKYDPFLHSSGVGFIFYMFYTLIVLTSKVEINENVGFILFAIITLITFLFTLEIEEN